MKGETMKDVCVFKNCKKVTDNGVCDEHTVDAVAVLKGAAPRCSHNRLWSDECLDCHRESTHRKLYDENVASFLETSAGLGVGASHALTASLKRRDVALRLLQVELRRVDVQSKLGPNGGESVATHLGVPAADGRMCRVDVDEDSEDRVTMSVFWGDRTLLTAGGTTAEVVGALTTYFIGVKLRAGGKR